MKVYYPIFLDLTDRPVLVAGAGRIALRKTKALVESGARVTVVAPEILPAFRSLDARLLERRFRVSDLNGVRLAFAATNVRAVNRRIALEAERRGVPVNVADAPAECGFLVPSRVRRGHLQIAVSTSGRNPRLAKKLRQDLEDLLRRATME